LSVVLPFLALSRDGAFSQSFELSAGDAAMSTLAKGFVGGFARGFVGRFVSAGGSALHAEPI